MLVIKKSLCKFYLSIPVFGNVQSFFSFCSKNSFTQAFTFIYSGGTEHAPLGEGTRCPGGQVLS